MWFDSNLDLSTVPFAYWVECQQLFDSICYNSTAFTRLPPGTMNIDESINMSPTLISDSQRSALGSLARSRSYQVISLLLRIVFVPQSSCKVTFTSVPVCRWLVDLFHLLA